MYASHDVKNDGTIVIMRLDRVIMMRTQIAPLVFVILAMCPGALSQYTGDDDNNVPPLLDDDDFPSENTFFFRCKLCFSTEIAFGPLGNTCILPYAIVAGILVAMICSFVACCCCCTRARNQTGLSVQGDGMPLVQLNGEGLEQPMAQPNMMQQNVPRFDPTTGQPTAAPAHIQAPRFDPTTGQPIAAAEVPMFDPTTGAPLAAAPAEV